MNKLDDAALAIGSLSCVIVLASIVSACARLTTEEKLSHLAVECVYTRLGEICEKERPDESVPVPQSAP